MRTLLLLLPIFLIPSLLTAQSYVTGGELEDPTIYQKIPQISFYTGSKSDELPYQVDLVKGIHLPIQKQGKYQMCTSMAVTNAFAIVQAKRTKKQKVGSSELPSAWYLHRMTNENRKRNCEYGLSISSVLEQFKMRGTLPDQNGLSRGDCQSVIKQPTSYRIKDYFTLFSGQEHPAYKANQIQNSLIAGKPVIFNIPVDVGFTRLTKENNTYRPQPGMTKSLGIHTMTIVGYNAGKQAYKVLNSWGADWGNNGYCWIPYEIVEKGCQNAFQIQLPNQDISATTIPTVKENAKYKIEGQFNINVITGDEEPIPNGTYQPLFDKRSLIQQNNYFVPQPAFKSHEMFQIVAKDLHYIYAFSFDGKRNLKSHFPKSQKDICPGAAPEDDHYFTPYVPGQTGKITIPRYNNDNFTFIDRVAYLTHPNLLKKTVAGSDYFVMLYSLNELPESVLSNLLCELEEQANSDNFVPTFYDVFKNHLMPQKDIQYDTNQMKFSGASDRGFVVPVIIKIE